MAMVRNIFPKCPDQKCIKRKNNNTCRTQRSGLPDQWQWHDLVTCQKGKLSHPTEDLPNQNSRFEAPGTYVWTAQQVILMLTGTCRVGNEESPDLDNQGER